MANFGDAQLDIITVPVHASGVPGRAYIRPPVAGEEWEVINLLPTGLIWGLTDGSLHSHMRFGGGDYANRKKVRVYITRDKYLFIENYDTVTTLPVMYSALVTRNGGEAAGVGDVKADVVSLPGGVGAQLTVQPPAGQVWMVHELGTTVWGSGNPGTSGQLTDGSLTVISPFASNDARAFQFPFLIDNAHYMKLDSSGGTTYVSYSAVRVA